MLKAAPNGEFNVLFIESQSRLGRDQAEIHSTIKWFRKWGIKVISVATGTDLTDEDTGIIITTTTA
jgi:DNA invertase Pin-like site-specific DNA recombinase